MKWDDKMRIKVKTEWKCMLIWWPNISVGPANILGITLVWSPNYTSHHLVWKSHMVWWLGFHCLNNFPRLFLVSIGEWSSLSSRSEVCVLGECKCHLCQWFFHCRGKWWEWVPSWLGWSPNSARNRWNNKICTTSRGAVHTNAEITTHKVR